MVKYIGLVYKHVKSQLLTIPIKEPVLSSSAYQTSLSTELTITPVSSVIDKRNRFRFLFPKNHPE